MLYKQWALSRDWAHSVGQNSSRTNILEDVGAIVPSNESRDVRQDVDSCANIFELFWSPCFLFRRHYYSA